MEDVYDSVENKYIFDGKYGCEELQPGEKTKLYEKMWREKIWN